MYTNREHTEVGVRAEYMAAPSIEGKTLIIVDPMLATGGSMAAGYEALLKNGKPASLHIACVIATEEGLGVVEQAVPEDTTVWCASIDPGMNEHKYIVPGLVEQATCVMATSCDAPAGKCFISEYTYILIIR